MAGTALDSRKARRKEKRHKKKRKSLVEETEPEQPSNKVTQSSAVGSNNNKPTKKKKVSTKKGAYSHLSPDLAAALRADDAEIAALEAKLGLKSTKDKSRLHKEYAKLEGYGEDFGDLLDDLDGMVARVTGNKARDTTEDEDEPELDAFTSDNDDEEDEEILPMKGPAFDEIDEDDSFMGDVEAQAAETSDRQSSDEDEGDGSDDDEPEAHENAEDALYRPTKGEDIYGNVVNGKAEAGAVKKYVPPHMRKSENDKDREASLAKIKKALNSTLNRLSEDTLVSVSQSITQLYPLHPTSDVNECIWINARSACVSATMPMVGLIPTYIAALVGVHVQKGDAAQLGEHLIEMVVTDLWSEVSKARAVDSSGENESEEPLISKEPSNLMLMLCYMYNFGVAHCSLMYDVVRELIKHFREVDVELLLLVLSHSGRTLRSDDPSALKEIVLLVQKRALDEKGMSSSSSRVDFMVSAMMDLKNNKKRKQDAVYAEKTTKLRKLLGQIKGMVASSNNSVRHSDSSLRLTLDNVLNAETKGRWWKVGASWAGNQHMFREDGGAETLGRRDSGETTSVPADEETQKLLKLASKYRMNTETRRSIFCIIMGSMDCEDSFEKLVRAGMLKNRTERETVRVLMECCGNEKAYNKFYSHLAARICEYQAQCKFSFQLAFWDTFKQFEELKVRKAANLARLLFHLVVVHNCLKLNVLKSIDMSEPEQLCEQAMIFLTIFLSSVLEHFEEPVAITKLFKHGISQRRRTSAEVEKGADELDQMDEGDALKANLTVFFMQVMKSSPKYKKGSKFKANLKAAIKACDTDEFL